MIIALIAIDSYGINYLVINYLPIYLGSHILRTHVNIKYILLFYYLEMNLPTFF